jgi:hypothetical protein
MWVSQDAARVPTKRARQTFQRKVDQVIYLTPDEYIPYGLSADIADDWIAMASSLIDQHCRRPSLAITEYTERLRLTAGSQTMRLSYRPLAIAADQTSPLLQIRVRYGRPRRGEFIDNFREQVACAFSLPGSWSTLDLANVDINTATGELTLPENLLGIHYNEVEITYTSGFATIPAPVKFACAQLVRNAQAAPALNVKSSRIDTAQMEYFSGSLLDPQVLTLLRPYVAERLG